MKWTWLLIVGCLLGFTLLIMESRYENVEMVEPIHMGVAPQ